jgi:hypothetical protein
LRKAAYAPYIQRIGRAPAPIAADYPDLIAQGTVSVLLEGGELRGVLALKWEHATLWIENISQYRRLGYKEVERRAAEGFHRVFMRKLLDPTATSRGSIAST